MPSTEQLMTGLVGDLGPVRQIARLRTVAFGALVLGAVSAGVVIGLRGLRPELIAGHLQPSILLVAIGLTIVALGGVVAALGSAVPGREQAARIGLGALFAGFVLAAGTSGWVLCSMGVAAWEGLGLRCTATALLGGILPAVGLLAFLVGAFPARPAASVAAAAGGAVGLGGIAAHVSCPATGGLHVFVGHTLAPLVCGVLLALGVYAVLVRLRRRPPPEAFVGLRDS
jgi:hypothetical protein